ncbi:hypothetical protein SAY87_003879 [Trapa incisa]|uniref:Serine/threonine-protein phosphatase 2A 55 kDa regulatory subunit B n=1 Tax=Trapa incisa TaxID=236973 RepID=A0AAN7JNG7_9MYRT|nr:hypothetical protein SAY87_003879 [Trapa incisa]
MSLHSSSRAPIDWRFSQVFGERAPGEELQDADIISAIEFDKRGDHLAVGDRSGRVVIFKRSYASNELYSQSQLEQLDSTPTLHPEYRYMTEFQSHEPEFDYLRSLEIEEKINSVRWCAAPNGALFILSTNDKTIKLWKVKERKLKKANALCPDPHVSSENALLAERSFVSETEETSITNGYQAESGEKVANQSLSSQGYSLEIANIGYDARSSCQRTYAHAHDFNIHSISTNSDGETFISADDLRINLWNLQISNQCFNIVDIKPANMEDLTEVITSAEFHPVHCNMLAYSSSRGFIYLVDMRQSALCDHNARILQDDDSHGFKSFFTEIIASISDIKFAADGLHILSRDYLSLKLWDLRNESKPIKVYKIHEHLRAKLPELYNNDAIFDKFDCCVSGDGSHFATGSYSNLLRVFSDGSGSKEVFTIEASKNPNRKSLLTAAPRARRTSLSNLARGFYRQVHENSFSGSNDTSCDLSSKLLHLAWHPTANMIACAAGNSLFMYYA